MAVREYDFDVGFTTGQSPDPAAPSQSYHAVSKGYADSTYGRRASWYESQTNNAAVKAIASADRFDGQIVLNKSNNSFYRFDSASAAADDGDTVLAPDAGTGRWLKITSSGGGSGDSLIQEFDKKDAGITAGGALANRDACSMELHNGTGSDVYRIFKADADDNARRSFAGFTKSAVTVTPNIKTYTISAAYVSGNVVPMTINGRAYSVNFTTSSDNTLKLLRDAIAADQDLASAVVTVEGGDQTGSDDRVITITANGGLSLNITGTTITGGASQPTVTIAQTQAAAGGTVDLHQFGSLDGFTGLTPGDAYYLSTTAGAITNSPTVANPVFVGRALNSTTLFVDPSGAFAARFGNSAIMVRSHGSSSLADGGGTQDAEHWNFTAWAAGTAASLGARWAGGAGESGYNKLHHYLDGKNTGGTVSALAAAYNKASWSSFATRPQMTCDPGKSAFSGFLYAWKGSTDGASTSCISAAHKWNGTSWASPGNFGTPLMINGIFVQNSLLRSLGGNDNTGSYTVHNTINTSDVGGSDTALPSASASFASANITSSDGFFVKGGTTTAYVWNGSWATLTVSFTADYAAASGFQSSASVGWTNGGGTGGAATNKTERITTASSTASTASTNSRCKPGGSVI